MSTVKTLGESNVPKLAQASSAETVSQLWFKTKPISRKFCYRAVQLQLETISSDQGHDESHGNVSWSWFELVVFKDGQSEEPVIKNGQPLVWKSHNNRTDPLDTRAADSLHFGIIFDRRHDLFDLIEIGNVIGIRVCAKHPGWINDAQYGRLRAKYVHYDLFSPMAWHVGEGLEASTNEAVTDGVYTLTPPTECHLISKTDEQTDAIWFTTPILDENTIPKFQDIQLFTTARHQGVLPEGATGIWSWFDIVILDTPESTQPKVKDGRVLVWLSHEVPAGQLGDVEQDGKLFGPDHEIFTHLQPGNVIAVRPSTRFAGWELHAQSARLVVRLSNKGRTGGVPRSQVDWAKVIKRNKDLQAALEQYLTKATSHKDPAAVSVETTLLTQELRADRDDNYGEGERPLRLLSLDGGGVRGISALHILKDIMGKVTGDKNAKPCDYFDMMAGTSTGGLIAIMLGRLRMSIDECIDAYEDLASEIFGAGPISKVVNGATTGARYSGDTLANAVKKVIGKHAEGNNPDAPMLDPEDGCKVFVLACRADDLSNSVATHLRTYTNKEVEKSFNEYKIWEAARATSAAPTYFTRIKLGDHEYIDGGVGFNNPVLLLMGEARLYFGFARPIGCLVTIGTGMNPNVVLPDVSNNPVGNIITTAGTIKSMWELVTTSEHANIMARNLLDSNLYFRFNVGKKLVDQTWIKQVSPTFWERIFGKEEEAQKYTEENWASLDIALDDYKQMAALVKLTLEFMTIPAENDRAKRAADKLPPKKVPKKKA
ncbi:phospholipase [Coprinopsis cinerea okayama7|uniref:Phospholipase n=1 Tax=Coprinopsis cinerea (strain Okayama-7 / 130 / ATCC MYA-4618 / FGSC 9003) TaxID=240176 RepID=A8NQZ1_COPC7|nr:phospholipase [Coprinopsis cinerea okayama7\|eukprot:XP_001835581.2 phospholipase [Coprinopsis cinerea okayama7\